MDSSVEDGDRMTVIINGEKVLSNATMFSKNSISYPLINGENVVEIIAENEGEKANNTTRIELIDKRRNMPYYPSFRWEKDNY